ncbi:hypothetical protein MLD38_000184 [Melastoma candidum]|uniref:Uncharacterized protein n=1 Tax=Melastoma candidum TaxID=119954 RepID=A0ACB9S8M2_9MYRT|nr:hypothetical protein MLD38_000184 [Melastoma candidum]
MNLMNVKSEGSSGGRHRTRMADPMKLEQQMMKCTKRRRRDFTLGSVVSEDGGSQKQQGDQVTAVTTMKRSSKFRGVSRHRWTGRFEAHLWDKQSWNVTQKKKGKQGAYDEEDAAARAYDLAALKYWGASTFTNFPVSDYEKEVEEMKSVTKEEYLASLRRKSSGFSRGVSKYRGVARHHHNGRWEARIGRVFGNKYLYLGTYSKCRLWSWPEQLKMDLIALSPTGTQEEAARAYDIAAIEYRGINAVTNFDLSTYIRWLKPGTSTHAVALEQQAARQTEETEIVLENTGFNPRNDPIQLSQFSTNHFRTNYLEPKEDVVMQKLPFNLNKKSSSSPTALGLLLRSSVFRELMQKNTPVNEDDTDAEEAKNTINFHLDEEYPGLLYDGTTGNGGFQYMCSTGYDEIELSEEDLQFAL